MHCQHKHKCVCYIIMHNSKTCINVICHDIEKERMQCCIRKRIVDIGQARIFDDHDTLSDY